MIVLFQRMMYRVDLRMNPTVLYLMGENERGYGMGGQAKEMRDEPNMRPIRTKRAPGITENCYWTDDDYERQIGLIDHDFEKLLRECAPHTIVVCPLNPTGDNIGLGAGMSQLPVRAPRTYAYICEWVKNLSL